MNNKKFSRVSQTPNRERVPLNTIVGNLKYYDRKPPYQRGFVWHSSYKRELIRSILRGVPINTIHLVEKGVDNPHKYVMDGKQRIETINAFTENAFAVDIQDILPDYDKKEIKWKDLADANDGPLASYRQKFDQFNIDVVTWPPMSIEEQRNIFTIINNSESLNTDEKNYCARFLTQKFLTYCFKECIFKHLEDNLPKRYIDDKKFAGIRLLHQIFILLSGSKLTGSFETRSTGGKSRAESAIEIEEYLYSKGIDATGDFNEEIITRLGYNSLIQDIEDAVKWFKKAMDYNNKLTRGKKWPAGATVDIIVMLARKKRDKILTSSYIEHNLNKIYNFIVKWDKVRDQDEDIKRRSTTERAAIVKRFKLLESTYLECNIDDTVKDKSLSDFDKRQAILHSNGKCPVLNVPLTDDTVQFDHLIPKSISGDPETVGAISAIANRRKSDNSPDMLDALSDYANKKSDKID